MQMSRFISTELKSDSESPDLQSDLETIGTKFDAELMTKLGLCSEMYFLSEQFI